MLTRRSPAPRGGSVGPRHVADGPGATNAAPRQRSQHRDGGRHAAPPSRPRTRAPRAIGAVAVLTLVASLSGSLDTSSRSNAEELPAPTANALAATALRLARASTVSRSNLRPGLDATSPSGEPTEPSLAPAGTPTTSTPTSGCGRRRPHPHLESLRHGLADVRGAERDQRARPARSSGAWVWWSMRATSR